MAAPAASADPLFEPDPVEFFDQVVDTASTPISVTVTDDGGAPYAVSDVFLDGDDADQFEIVSDSCTGTAVTDSAGCAVSVRHTPTFSGDHVAILVLDNDSGGDAFGVLVTGFAYDPPPITAMPDHLGFPSTRVGGSSAAQPIQLTNDGEGPARIESVGVTGADAAYFEKSSDHCSGVSLSIGEHCLVELKFGPGRVGRHDAQLVVESGSGDSPDPIPLAGDGLQVADILVEPAAIDLGTVTPPLAWVKRDVVIRNLSGGAITPVVVVTGLAGRGDVQVEGGTVCRTFNLAAGKSCKVSLTFAGKHDGPIDGRLEVHPSLSEPALASAPVTGRVTGMGLAAMRKEMVRTLRTAAARWSKSPRRTLLRRGFRTPAFEIVEGRLSLKIWRAPHEDVLLARVTKAITPTGMQTPIEARLTRAGRRLLARQRPIRLTVRMTAKETGGGTATALRDFRLPRVR